MKLEPHRLVFIDETSTNTKDKDVWLGSPKAKGSYLTRLLVIGVRRLLSPDCAMTGSRPPGYSIVP